MPTQKPLVQSFYDPRTSSLQYVVADPATRQCAVIDPVLDYDQKSGSVATTSADAILAWIAEQGLSLVWVLDTHPHADHFSASAYLKQKTGARNAIGARITGVQQLWADFYDWPELKTDGSQWDRLFSDGDVFHIGELPVRVMFSPGHTLASITYVAGDAAFIHDTLFMPDGGTARADFPGGSSAALWETIQAIMSLPDDTRLFTGHDYQPGGRPLAFESTVAEQRAKNIHLTKYPTGPEFIAARDARDATLPMPALILHALQININGGRLPEPGPGGRRLLRIPLGVFGDVTWG